MRLLFLIFCAVCISCNAHQQASPQQQSVDTFKLPANNPTVIIEPTLISTKAKPIDSTYLKIEIQKISYKISLLNDSLSTTDAKKIDEFISGNKSKINDDKIILIGSQNASFKKVDKILNVLKKNEIFRYKLLTIPSN
jgi:hypothetical protein